MQLRIVLGSIEEGNEGVVGEDDDLYMFDDPWESTGHDSSAVGFIALCSIRAGIWRRRAEGAEVAGHQNGDGKGGRGYGRHYVFLF